MAKSKSKTTTKNKNTQKQTNKQTQKVLNEYESRLSGVTETGPAYSLEDQRQFFNNLRSDLSYLFGDTSKYTDYDYGINYDPNSIQSALDKATQAAYDASRIEGRQNLRNASNLAAAQQASSLADLRRNMMTSAINGANAGQVNANVLSAFLNNQQSNAEAQTAALQNLQNIAEQRRAAMAENASNAISQANQAAISRGELLNAEQANRVAALAGTLGQALYGTGQGNAQATKQRSETYDNVLVGSTTETTGKTTTKSNGKTTVKSSGSSKGSSGGSGSTGGTVTTSSAPNYNANGKSHDVKGNEKPKTSGKNYDVNGMWVNDGTPTHTKGKK